MKLANIKGMVAKVLTVGFVAGAVVMFAPEKGQAQEVYFGVGNGGYYAQDGYARHEYFEHERAEEFRRREEFERRQAWLRDREFRHEQDERREHQGYGRGFDRDHYDRERFDRDRNR